MACDLKKMTAKLTDVGRAVGQGALVAEQQTHNWNETSMASIEPAACLTRSKSVRRRGWG